MTQFKFGEFVWCNGEGWLFIGQTEDGEYLLSRRIKDICYDLIETHRVDLNDEDELDEFLKENGESLSEKYKRKK